MQRSSTSKRKINSTCLCVSANTYTQECICEIVTELNNTVSSNTEVKGDGNIVLYYFLQLLESFKNSSLLPSVPNVMIYISVHTIGESWIWTLTMSSKLLPPCCSTIHLFSFMWFQGPSCTLCFISLLIISSIN